MVLVTRVATTGPDGKVEDRGQCRLEFGPEKEGRREIRITLGEGRSKRLSFPVPDPSRGEVATSVDRTLRRMDARLPLTKDEQEELFAWVSGIQSPVER